MTTRLPVRPVAALSLAALLLASPATAQTVLGLDAGAGAVVEWTGPPAGPCAYPNGPVIGGFPVGVPFACPTPGPIVPAPFGLLGDVATDRAADTIWVTDGFALTEFTPAGLPITSFAPAAAAVVPGPLTSLGFGAGTLWVSDGAFIAGIVPPPAPGCGAPIVLAAPPWPVPAGVGFVTDLAFDPVTGTLWASTAGGLVANLFIGGGVGAIIPVAGAACPVGVFGPLTGIAYDTATPSAVTGGPPMLYVTDGAMVSYLSPFFAAPLPTFYTPVPCYPVPSGPVSGLASTLHGITFGAGFDPLGLPPPVHGTLGQSTSPSATFAITLAGTDPTPGTIAALYVDFAGLCPPIPFAGGNPLYVLPTLVVGPFPVVGGAVLLPAAIPPSPFIGLSVYTQWIVGKGSGGVQVSNGGAFTLGLP